MFWFCFSNDTSGAGEDVAWYVGLGRVGECELNIRAYKKFLKNRKEGTIAYIPFCLQVIWIISKNNLDFMK